MGDPIFSSPKYVAVLSMYSQKTRILIVSQCYQYHRKSPRIVDCLVWLITLTLESGSLNIISILSRKYFQSTPNRHEYRFKKIMIVVKNKNSNIILKSHLDKYRIKIFPKKLRLDIPTLKYFRFLLLLFRFLLDSDLIPRLLEIFEKLKTLMIILLSIKNDAYSRILRV